MQTRAARGANMDSKGLLQCMSAGYDFVQILPVVCAICIGQHAGTAPAQELLLGSQSYISVALSWLCTATPVVCVPSWNESKDKCQSSFARCCSCQVSMVSSATTASHHHDCTIHYVNPFIAGSDSDSMQLNDRAFQCSH
eukprot:6176377-Pleurochrysis_carterae.AAC.3